MLFFIFFQTKKEQRKTEIDDLQWVANHPLQDLGVVTPPPEHL
jgi:hypothetical protein